MSSDRQVQRMTDVEIQETIRNSLQGQDVEDYTFEERYCRGVDRPVRVAQDEQDRQHYLRLESIVTKKCWDIFSSFLNNVRAHPSKVAGLWLDDEGEETTRWTYSELYERSRVVAAHLDMTYKIKKGDRVLLAYEPCIEFFAAFWACVGTGIIAVPVCPPDPFNPNSDMTDKVVSVWKDSEPKLALTSANYKDSIAAARNLLGEEFEKVIAVKDVLDVTKRLWLTTTNLDFIPASEWDFPESDGFLAETDTVFLQYTSGSTGGAKGVEVTHRQLGANVVNCAMLTQGMGSLYVYQFSLGVSWLPTFHDMGLIGFHVAPMLIGGSMVYFSPLDFIKNPTMWLKVISRYKHVSSGAPPFALELCARRITPMELSSIDLSGLEVLVLGAEPIRASFMEAFTQKFQSYGFSPKAYMTCYGMAENILHVAGKWSNLYEARKVLVNSNSLSQGNLVVYKDKCVIDPERDLDYYVPSTTKSHETTDDKDCQWLISSGELVDFFGNTTLDPENNSPADLSKRVAHFYRREVASTVIIVNPDTMEECEDGQVGEIWITGPSKTIGYFRKPEINKENFQARLKKAVKKQTKGILEWAKANAEQTDRVDLTRFPVSVLEKTQEPMTKLLRFSMDNGEVNWLRSGDMGVIYENNIFITGRIKDMIIIRGQNYYADDLELAVTGGKSLVDVADGGCRAIAEDPGLAPLGWLRPGSAVAYSLTINSDGTTNCPAKKARVEGEHVCLIVELADDITTDDSIQEEDEEPTQNKLKKATKSGHQLPMWQRLALKYGGDIINGMSRAYEEQEQALMKMVSGSKATVWKKQASCLQRSRLAVQKMFFAGVRGTVSVGKSVLGLLDHGEHVVNQASLDHSKGEDKDTVKIKESFDDHKLDEIAAAIRRVLALRFMLPVGQIVFLAPRSVKKTSSGKKRRSEMVQMIESGSLEHRIVKRSVIRNIQNYFTVCEKEGKTPIVTTNHGKIHAKALPTIAAPKPTSKPAASAETTDEPVALGKYAKNALNKFNGMIENNALAGSISQDNTQYGGTVGIALDGETNAYKVNTNHAVNLVELANAKIERILKSEPLLPPVQESAPGVSDTAAKEAALKVVEKIETDAAKVTFESAKTKVLRIIVAKLNDISGEVGEQVTVEYLREMATKSALEQQQTLDEYGLDSMTGFELAKTLASEFELPTAMMGPHLFLQDPTIDGMVGVLVKLVKLHSTKAREEYIARFETKTIESNGKALVDSNTAAYMFRGSTDEKRIPYVLALGTAVPFSCGPQSEVMQAMLGPMKMNKKSEDRFIKLSENSGVGTRYSALKSLDEIFWGKEGVNLDNDEYVDARHAVYAVEAAKLSVKSAADALHDWMGAKVLKTDDEREKDRLERYMDVDKRHRLNLAKKRAAEKNKDIKVPEDMFQEEVEEDWTDLARRVEAYTDRQITHVVAVTCTGILVPGLEFHIMKGLGLPLTTQRLSIQFMGCFGAVSGIRCASALAAENPRNRVLVVCTELCTLHMQLNDKVDNLVASALFADGSGAMVVGCDPSPTERPLFAVHQCSSFIIPNTLEMMGWDMTRKGLIIGLAKEIASEIFNHIGDFVNNMLTHAEDSKHPGHRIGAKDCNLCLHPGGPLILNTIQNVLNVPQVGDGHGGGDIDPTLPSAESWEILREYGNMSSATLVFCLDRMREKAYKTDKWTPMVAFGPGLSIEGTLLKAVFPAANKDGTYNTTVKAEQQVSKANKTKDYKLPSPKDIPLTASAPKTATVL